MSSTTIDSQSTQSTTPPAGTWRIDPGHTEVAFIGRHFMLTKVRGRFEAIAGTIEVGDAPAATKVEVEIDMASVNSGSEDRDQHLRSSDLFDVAAHPRAYFRSTAVDWDGERGTMRGDLTIKDVTRPVVLDVTLEGAVDDPWGNSRLVFSASGQLNREDWGITWNMPLANGGLVVSKDIRLEIETEAVLEV